MKAQLPLYFFPVLVATGICAQQPQLSEVENIQMWNQDEWVNSQLVTNELTTVGDDLCRSSLMRMSHWDNFNAEWNDDSRTFYTYDVDGILESELKQVFNDEEGSWEDDQLCNYAYDSEGHLESTTVLQVVGGDWQNQLVHSYIYDSAGQMVTYMYGEWQAADQDWAFTRMETNVYNSEGLVAERTIQVAEIEDEWMNLSRLEWNYVGNTLQSLLTQSWNTFSEQWMNSTLKTYSYDEQSHLDHYASEQWNSIEQEWRNWLLFSYTYSMDGLNTVELLRQEWDSDVAAWSNSKRSSFSGFCATVGMAEDSDQETGLNIYPNPGKAAVVNFLSPNTCQAEVSISTMTGKQINTTVCQLTRGMNVIYPNSEELAPGVYTITVRTDGRVVSRLWVHS